MAFGFLYGLSVLGVSGFRANGYSNPTKPGRIYRVVDFGVSKRGWMARIHEYVLPGLQGVSR